MKYLSRQFALAVLVITMISLATAGVHAATHASLDLQTCDLCSAQGNPAFAIPPAALPNPPAAVQILVPEVARSTTANACRRAWQSRGPPRAA
ncbi:MAG: hypothetical protein WBN23_00070 [Woeseia sp.]